MPCSSTRRPRTPATRPRQLLYGLAVPRRPERARDRRPPEPERPRPGLKAHVREAGSVMPGSGWDPCRPTSAQLFVELAGSLSFVDAVVAGDAMVRARADHARGPRGFLRQAARASTRALRDGPCAYVREGVDSPMETTAAASPRARGPPGAEGQPSARRRSRGRDAGASTSPTPTLKLIVEFDGRHHIERATPVGRRHRSPGGAGRGGLAHAGRHERRRLQRPAARRWRRYGARCSRPRRARGADPLRPGTASHFPGR